MLANLYFRRFILAWKQFGYERKLQACVVNYADDLVICCRPGKGLQAMEVFRSLMTRLGLTVNERKTRLVKLPEEKIPEINSLLRGWCGYFSQGPVTPVYQLIRKYTERRVRRWLMLREQRHGTGYKQYPDAYLYQTLGLYQLPTSRAAVLKAKT